VPSSAAMRLIDTPAARSRAASSYRDCRRAREAALARAAALGLATTGAATDGGNVSADGHR
jgi:hypothetical protein